MHKLKHSGTSVAIGDSLGLEYIVGYLEKQGYKPKIIMQNE